MKKIMEKKILLLKFYYRFSLLTQTENLLVENWKYTLNDPRIYLYIKFAVSLFLRYFHMSCAFITHRVFYVSTRKRDPKENSKHFIPA